ncbi:MAG: T9SS type A sorting domain-containing protein [Flavobacteriaceae bacterium]|nr:T9SS type A sorting domain-containing protein [Flavobacteriaceae bacterium]
MKQLYTLLLMLPAMLFAQTDIDFQSISSGLPGPSWTWTADQPDTSFSVVDNPSATGINTSSNVGELTAAAGSNAWALAFSDGIGSFTFDANNTTVKIMVYKTRISPIEIKFEDASDSSVNVSRTVSNTVVNAWEELSFDFYSTIGNTSYSKIVIIPDNSTRTEANITYFDNITFTEGVASVGPTIALPVDFEEAVDAYEIAGFDGGVASIEAGPDNANSLKYIKGAGQNWAGVSINLDTAVDAANGEVITANVHSTVARDITLKFDAANVERKVSHGGTGWEAMSFDFTGDLPADQTKIAFFNDLTQQGDGSADWTIYIDNLAQTTGGTAGPTIALPVDFEEAADAYEITGFDGGVATVEAGPDNANSLKYVKGAGANWAGVKITLDTAVDGADGQIITADVHSTVARDITLKFDAANVERKVSHGGTGWEAMSFDFTGAMPADQTVIAFFNDLTQQGDGSADWTIYIDNLAQTGDGVTTPAGPTDAPSTPPTRNSWDVISVYGEAYGTAIGLNNTDWDKATFADETIAGNVVLKAEFAGGDYLGADLAAKIDASEMTHFHIDYWMAGDLLTGQTMNTKWSNHAGGDTQTSSFQDYNVGPEVGAWKSRDIEIEALTGQGNGDFSRAELAQLIVTLSAAGGTYPPVIYIDNVYFYRSATASINDIESNVNVYPNPVENTLNVSAGVVVDSVSIFDLTGREVMRATPNAAAFSLDVSSLNKGMYLVTVKAGEQELNTKLVK